VLIRPEQPDDVPAIRAVTAAAFAGLPYSMPPLEDDGAPGEATLVGRLRADPGWIPGLSLVAVDDDVIGHAVCTRGYVDAVPALGLGPVSVRPDRQGEGIGSALVRALLDLADARGEPLVALLGEPAYYSRFGFAAAAGQGIEAPDPAWGDYFQVRPLTAYDASVRGTFRYAEPFRRLG